MTSYYNEIDPHAAQWLRNLIAAGHIPAGDVDERSIEDVRPSDLAGYVQCHFFSGVGGWAYALQLAGWPADRPVWSGSCPCQPFSAAGTGSGFADERHLWPAWFHLIEQCRPVVIFGEQVEAAIRHDWLDLVHADLEGAGYTVGAADLCAAGVFKPHLRQRLYWVADSDGKFDFRSDLPRSGRAGSGFALGGATENQQEGDRGFDELVAMGLSERVSSYASARAVLDGIPGRVVAMRGAGNAIVPQVAAEFITAYLGVTP